MKTFLLFFLCCITSSSFAQNRAVKDNIACLYGIKNANGEWVVEPTYQELKGSAHGYFISGDGKYLGVLDHNGNEVISVKYDRIRPISVTHKFVATGMPIHPPNFNAKHPFLLEVEKETERSWFKLNGEQLVPFDVQSMRKDQENFIVSVYHDEKFTSCLINAEGDVLLDSVSGVLMPFGKRDFTLVGNYYAAGDDAMRGNVRVVNRQGEQIVADEFKKARIVHNGKIVFVTDNGKTGVMDRNGGILVPAKYFVEVAGYSQRGELPGFYAESQRLYIRDSLQRIGLMDGIGKVLCKPSYDNLKTGYGWAHTSSLRWRSYSGDLEGILNEDGQVTIPCIYDTLIIVPYNKTGGMKNAAFIAKKKDKYGILSYDGKEIIPIEYTFCEMKPNLYSIWLGKSGEVGIVSTKEEVLKLRSVETIFKDDKITLFKTASGDFRALGVDDTGDLKALNMEEHWNLRIIQANGRLYNFDPYIFNKDGKLLNAEESYRYEKNHRFVKVVTESQQECLIDAKTAKIIVAPDEYAVFEMRIGSTNHLWAKLKGEVEKWVILDTLGKRVTDIEFDQAFSLNQQAPVYAKIKGAWGVFDSKDLNWIVEPRYACISKIIEGVYRAQRSDQRWDVLKVNAANLATGAQKVEVLMTDYRNNHEGVVGALLEVKYANKTPYLIDLKGTKILGAKAINEKKMELAFASERYISSNTLQLRYNQNASYHSVRSASKLDSLNKAKVAFASTPVADSVYQYVLRHYNTWNAPSSGVVLSTKSDRCECAQRRRDDYKYELDYFCDDASSATISRYNRPGEPWDVGYYSVIDYVNFANVNGKPKRLTLLDIYKGDKELLYDDFLLTITENDKLELDCSTADNMLESIRNRFLFTELGLKLFLSQNRGDVQIIIPWTRLMEHNETKDLASKFCD
ncbi:MAG: hypothetical protein Crog4KO_24270 [Crocinitomicaceae bacterium]